MKVSAVELSLSIGKKDVVSRRDADVVIEDDQISGQRCLEVPGICSAGERLAAQAHLKPSSYAVLDAAWRVYVAPRWCETEIGRIRHSDVQVWIGDLIKGTAPGSHPKHPVGATSVIRAYGVFASTSRQGSAEQADWRECCLWREPAAQVEEAPRLSRASAGGAARSVRWR